MNTSYIGKPTSRVDGKDKVTGKAKYAAEFEAEDLLYGFVVSSPIAKGSILKIDTSEALREEGVVEVFSHENVKGLPWFDLKYKDMVSPTGSPFRPFYNNKIVYSQQPIALVVATTFEMARYAATLVRFEFQKEEPLTNLEENLDKAFKPPIGKVGFQKPKSRGDFKMAFSKAECKIQSEYFHGAEHHNPMEMHASTVIYGKDDNLTIYDKTQGVLNSQHYVAWVFGLPKKKVRVLSPFVGGAFGSGLRPQYQLFMAVLASLRLKQSVKFTLTRQQMFSFGHRPVTIQKLSLAASAAGQLDGISHHAYSETSQFENYTESIVNWSGMMYKCENVDQDYKLVKLDTYTPLDMRAPGAATGVTGMEMAMDELAYALKIDPLQLRLKNYTEQDPSKKKPFSSKELLQCYNQGAEKFGWSKRSMEPGSMKEGSQLIGWGMASGLWDAQQFPARAKAVLTDDGKLEVGSATADIGTGTYTIMTQIAAEVMGLRLEKVTFKLGDSSLPLALVEGGSATAGSVGTAVKFVCENLKEKLFKLAQKVENSPFAKSNYEDVVFQEGSIQFKHDPIRRLTYETILKANKMKFLEETSTALPKIFKQRKFAINTHSAVFVEVMVDEDLKTIKVKRVVSAIAAGKILNPKTARSQILGGVVWGISMAMHEDTFMDHNLGRFMNHNLAEYHIPVNADIDNIEVIFVEEHDETVNPMGVKGVGEIGIVGVAAAVANAIFHATGKRVRDLPITFDKLL